MDDGDSVWASHLSEEDGIGSTFWNMYVLFVQQTDQFMNHDESVRFQIYPNM